MKIIKTLADIHHLRESGEIGRALLDLLEHDFLDAARQAFPPDEEPDEHFNLEDYGYLVLLESGDSEAELKMEGLSREVTKIRLKPEFAEVLEIGATSVFRMIVMADNDYITRIYSQVGTQPPEFEEWFNSYAQ